MNEVIRDVRVTVLMNGYTKHHYITVERFAGESDEAAFAKALEEFRHRHGVAPKIVAVDLYPNRYDAESPPRNFALDIARAIVARADVGNNDDDETMYLGANPGDMGPPA
jgi:hypothetical protein